MAQTTGCGHQPPGQATPRRRRNGTSDTTALITIVGDDYTLKHVVYINHECLDAFHDMKQTTSVVVSDEPDTDEDAMASYLSGRDPPDQFSWVAKSDVVSVEHHSHAYTSLSFTWRIRSCAVDAVLDAWYMMALG